MNFGDLEVVHKKWNDILVLGKTIERNGKKYHMIGMTLDETAKLYIIEPFCEEEHIRRRKGGVQNQRKILKEHTGHEVCYLHSREFIIGNKKLEVQGGSGSPLRYSEQDYGTIQLFLDMMSAGWEAPEWLKTMEWDNLQLTTLEFKNVKKLPKYSHETAITIKHMPHPIRHTLEKTITLQVGKSRSLSFLDRHGEQVQCYINNVLLIDVWKDTEENFNNPKYKEHFSDEQIQQIKMQFFEALEQSCPKGTYYIGIEYECSKDIQLQFYSKEYLKSRPQVNKGRAVSMMMNIKPEKEFGTHSLPLKGCMIQTAVSSDTTKIPAELFCYYEKNEPWEEQI